jgi:hypothetical protein
VAEKGSAADERLRALRSSQRQRIGLKALPQRVKKLDLFRLGKAGDLAA